MEKPLTRSRKGFNVDDVIGSAKVTLTGVCMSVRLDIPMQDLAVDVKPCTLCQTLHSLQELALHVRTST